MASPFHGREPATGLKDEQRRWLRELLDWPSEPAAASLTHGEIALAAYFIWKEQGCPDGRADEHWRLAIERLQQVCAVSGPDRSSPP